MAHRRKLHVFLRDAGAVVLINGLVAVGLTLVALGTLPDLAAGLRGRVLVNNLVISQAIGLTIFGLIEWPRLTWWWSRKPRLPVLLAVAGMAIVGGYLIGGAIAAALLQVRFAPLVQAGPAALIAGTTTLATSCFALYFILQRERLAEERQRAETADALARQARLQLLQQQIEPHMLFNSLANAHALVETDPARAQLLLEALGELLHASLQLSDRPMVELREEFALLRHYLQLMSVRMGPRLQFSLSLPPALEAVRIPPLTLQPLVENAVRHGLAPQVHGGSLSVRAFGEGADLVVEVADDGVGVRHDDAGARRPGIGLRNVRQRLACAYGERARLQLADRRPRGAVATLRMPQGEPAP